MQLYGNQFIKALSRLIVVAEGNDLARLKSAFFDYWAKYEDVAKNMRVGKAEPVAKD